MQKCKNKTEEALVFSNLRVCLACEKLEFVKTEVSSIEIFCIT